MQANNNDMVEFFKNGFLIKEFKECNTLKKVNENLKNILNNQVKSNFLLEEKYANTKDLRPTAYNYDTSFLDIIFNNDVHLLLDHITQKNLLLGHVQVRTSKAGHSYMPWHRDVYSTDNRDAGMMPPAIKLIYYLPTQNYENKLEILQSSHRLVLNGLSEKSDFLLPGFSNFDKQLFNFCNRYEFKNNNSNYIIFDTSCAHSVSETKEDSVRIIYSFATEHQIKSHFNSEHHLNLMEHYKCLKIKK